MKIGNGRKKRSTGLSTGVDVEVRGAMVEAWMPQLLLPVVGGPGERDWDIGEILQLSSGK